jgi:hypothetical protein
MSRLKTAGYETQSNGATEDQPKSSFAVKEHKEIKEKRAIKDFP